MNLLHVKAVLYHQFFETISVLQTPVYAGSVMTTKLNSVNSFVKRTVKGAVMRYASIMTCSLYLCARETRKSVRARQGNQRFSRIRRKYV
jgi:hypothetical protein